MSLVMKHTAASDVLIPHKFIDGLMNRENVREAGGSLLFYAECPPEGRSQVPRPLRGASFSRSSLKGW
jgi:hypothetical protein